MPEISRLSGNREWIDLDVVERKRTPEPAMVLGIQSHVAGLSLSDTVELLASLGVKRSRKQSMIGYRKPIYSPNLVGLRIKSRSTRS